MNSLAIFGDNESAHKLHDNHFMFFCYCVLKYKHERHLSQDWESLRNAVHQWQNERQLGWQSVDIDQVAAYLNARFFGFPAPE